MNSHSLTRLIYSTGNSIYYSAAKGILIIFVLTGIFEAQTVVAVDFKTYLQGARSEIRITRKAFAKTLWMRSLILN